MQSQQRDLISRIMSVEKKYKKYIDSLRKIDIKELENLDASDLQKDGVTNAEDRRKIYKIIQEHIVDNKQKRCIFVRNTSHQTLIRLICANNKFKKYRYELSKIEDRKLAQLTKDHLVKLGIKDPNDRNEIYQIIQDIVDENKKKQSSVFRKISTHYLKEMGPLIQGRTKKDFVAECAHDCTQTKNRCYPLKRIEVFLDVYNRVASEQSIFNQIPMSEIILISDDKQKNVLYGHQELNGDFQHLQIFHCNSESKKKDLLKHMNTAYKCRLKECVPFKRHYREKNDENGMDLKLYYAQYDDYNDNEEYVSKSLNIVNEKDSVLQQKCDQIHAYFLHSDDCVSPMNNDELNPNQMFYARRSRINKDFTTDFESKEEQMSVPELSTTKMKSIEYLGKKEDETWYRSIEITKDMKQSDDENDEMYRYLYKKMGTFRWQIAHGFKPRQNRSLQHLKPLFKDIKEEALCNKYEPLSPDNWNQTLRKSKVFFQSWAKPRMRTKYDGYYVDEITGRREEWNRGTEPTMEEIVTLKLYTDYDKLQFALKKCLRFDVPNNKIEHFSRTNSYDEDEKNIPAKEELEHRICSFFHWRGKLMIVLSKFATKLSEMREVSLYFGINTKMNVCPTNTHAFYGPFSTSTSFHVARTFSTAKGMTLKISSQFPRLGHCKAFDASIISDYPEEQEYLIQFMYVRVEEISTKELFIRDGEYAQIVSQYSIASLMREEFFSLHLFQKQMFCMKESLGRNVAQYLRVNRRECCDNFQLYKNKYPEDEKNKYKKYRDGNCWDEILQCVAVHAKHENEECTGYDDGYSKLEKAMEGDGKKCDDLKRMKRMRQVLWSKFVKWREATEIVTFDHISDILKRFFMEYGTEKDINNNKYKWVISFDDICCVYPNIKEIHFMNQYKFDNDVLRKLIRKIKEKEQKLNKVTFSYYDYVDDNKSKLPTHDKFVNPKDLAKDLVKKLEVLNWSIEHDQVANAGYKIKVSKI